MALAGSLWPNWVSTAEPTSQASGWRTQNWRMSDIVAEAALTACAAPTFDSGTFIESGVGSSITTMLSQNALRIRKNMTLPFVPHDCPIAVEDTLAEALEGEVRSVRSILRMFDSSFQRVFLKFERFSSLRKDARGSGDCTQIRVARDGGAPRLRARQKRIPPSR